MCRHCEHTTVSSIPVADEENYLCDKCVTILEVAARRRTEVRTKGAEFLIWKDPSYFTNGITDSYPISYRLVILNILHKLIHCSKSAEVSSIKDKFNSLMQAIEQKQEYTFDAYNNHILVYIFKDTLSEYGHDVNAVLVDKTKGTSPMFFYSKSTEGTKGYRVDALYSSLKEIFDQIEEWVALLREIDEEDLLDKTAVKDRICEKLTKLREEHE